LFLFFYPQEIFHFFPLFFIRNFIETFSVGNEFEAFYIRQLGIMYRLENYVLDLDCTHLYNNIGTRTLYKQLKKYPQEVVPILDHVVTEIFVR
jgi:DNA replication licensing factor MCM4